MQRKLAGIFILLSFLLFRNTNLMAVQEAEHVHKVVFQDTESPSGDTGKQTAPESFPDEEKESKQTEAADEDCLPAQLSFSSYTADYQTLESFISSRIPEVYCTLPYPPPDANS